MASGKNITIKDIAKMSGVSAGTVDRVLHSRGKVSQEAFQKVIKVLNEIDYKPNLIARSLSAKKNYTIVVLVPSPDLDPYWKMANAGIIQAQVEWSQYGIIVETYFFDLMDKESYKKVAQEVQFANPDAILTAPIFYQEALPFFEHYNKESIPYVLFNTNIPEVNPLSFIGQDLYQSGRVAAELLHLGQDANSHYAILHIVEDSRNAIHLKEKEKGFKDFMTEYPDSTTTIHTYNPNSLFNQSEGSLSGILNNPDLKGLFVTTSTGTTQVAAVLKNTHHENIRLVGYDLLKENMEYMQEGVINFLINQNPKKQAFIGISHLANYLLFKKTTPSLSLFPLEVITRQNMSSYTSSRLN